jgi:hypothetical protein
MLTHFRRPVQFSLTSFDMPLWSNVDTIATIYQRDTERFHLLLTEPKVCEQGLTLSELVTLSTKQQSRLIWLEMSASRVTLTMQGNGSYSYRHVWEQGVYGTSRYWLQGEGVGVGKSRQLQMRNFALNLELESTALPQYLHIDYELWSGETHLGRYMLNLDIQN